MADLGSTWGRWSASQSANAARTGPACSCRYAASAAPVSPCSLASRSTAYRARMRPSASWARPGSASRASKKYRCFWVRLDGLEKHWERARVDAALSGSQGGLPVDVTVRVDNVSAFTLTMPPGACPLDSTIRPRVRVYEASAGRRPPNDWLEAAPVLSDRSWVAHFRKV